MKNNGITNWESNFESDAQKRMDILTKEPIISYDVEGESNLLS
jgi:hypothetical protein